MNVIRNVTRTYLFTLINRHSLLKEGIAGTRVSLISSLYLAMLCLLLLPLMWGQSGHPRTRLWSPLNWNLCIKLEPFSESPPVLSPGQNQSASINKTFYVPPPRLRHPRGERLKANHFSWCPHFTAWWFLAPTRSPRSSILRYVSNKRQMINLTFLEYSFLIFIV